MKCLISILSILCLAFSVKAQYSTYITKIGNYKGSVKSVTQMGDRGTSMNFFNPDGTINKSYNSNRDEYIVFEWDSETITQNFYKTVDDSYIGSSKLTYFYDAPRFMVSNGSTVSFLWDFEDHTLTVFNGTSMKDENLIYTMGTVNITDAGYDSIIMKDNKVTSKISCETLDRDKYGNPTRLIIHTPDGVVHESTVIYDYYE